MSFSPYFSPIYRLKELFRQGWIGKVPTSEIESIAEHSFSVASLALILVPIENRLRRLAQQDHDFLNKLTVLERALVHDLPESQYLDMDKSFSRVLGEDRLKIIKEELDIKAEDAINSNIKNLEEKIFSLQQESILPPMNDKTLTLENEFIKLLDSLELFLQTTNYLTKNFISKDLAEPFLISTRKKITSYSETFLIVPYLFQEKKIRNEKN